MKEMIFFNKKFFLGLLIMGIIANILTFMLIFIPKILIDYVMTYSSEYYYYMVMATFFLLGSFLYILNFISKKITKKILLDSYQVSRNSSSIDCKINFSHIINFFFIPIYLYFIFNYDKKVFVLSVIGLITIFFMEKTRINYIENITTSDCHKILSNLNGAYNSKNSMERDIFQKILFEKLTPIMKKLKDYITLKKVITCIYVLVVFANTFISLRKILIDENSFGQAILVILLSWICFNYQNEYFNTKLKCRLYAKFFF